MNIVLLLLLLISTTSFADVVVIYDPNTNEVYSISSQNDAVVPAGYIQTIVTGNAEDFYSVADAKDYKFENNKLKLNAAKINKKERELQKARDKKDELQEVQREMRKETYNKMKQNGYNFKELKDTDL